MTNQEIKILSQALTDSICKKLKANSGRVVYTYDNAANSNYLIKCETTDRPKRKINLLAINKTTGDISPIHENGKTIKHWESFGNISEYDSLDLVSSLTFTVNNF